jgi:hypothetical protein
VVVAPAAATAQTAADDIGRELASLRRELQALRAEVESLKSARTVTAAEACAGREWHVGRREPEVYGKRNKQMRPGRMVREWNSVSCTARLRPTALPPAADEQL